MNNDARDLLLRRIAKELDIPEEKRDNAIKSYESVGEYLGNNISKKVEIFPQGSFRLGTVIKPLSDEDDYDIDLVCKIDMKSENPKEVKNIVGDALKRSERYKEMLKNEEGRRCWTLEFASSAKFHMDILPSIESERYTYDKTLKITDYNKEKGEYKFLLSNPEAYFEWFNEKSNEEMKILKENYAVENRTRIEDVPDYKIKTTLQIATQILKRYRDKKFEKDPDNKPISIILTTIMGKAYSGENNVYELICKFSKEWKNHITTKDGVDWIENPVNPNENFADKWGEHPERREAFYKFTRELKEDIANEKFIVNVRDGAQNYKDLFGERIVERATANLGKEAKKLEEYGKMYVNTDSKINFEKKGTQVTKHSNYGK